MMSAETILPENEIAGYEILLEAYACYCKQAELEQKAPISFLSYIAALF